LVDGHHLFHRTYHALPRSIVGTDGAPIQGVYGFVGALLRLLRRFTPTHLAVPFDPPEPPFRRALFPAYRTGRPRGTPEEVANFDRQVTQVLQVLDHLAIPYPMLAGFEADDVMGTLATAAATASLPVTLVSGDRDLLQVVSPGVDLFMPKGQDGDVYTPAAVMERWGVRPAQIPDLKALVGDPSDHIPGVPGIGPKTAAALLARHESLDALYAHLSELPVRQADALRAHQERVWLNRRLVTIVTTVDVPIALAAYRWARGDTWTAGTLLAALGLRG
jgi:DNA polymerase-1